MTAIPSVTRSLDYNDVHQVIVKNYSLISKEYITFLSEWVTDTNKIFNDSEMFNILIYIFNKNLEFYNNNLIEFDYEAFNKTNQFEIQKINIVEISKYLNIPKETTRRKILQLEKKGVIRRIKKEIIIDKNSFILFDINNTLKSLTNIIFKIYSIFLQEKIITDSISKEEIIQKLKKRFSFVMFHYFEFIIPWQTRWKKYFKNDSELFIIWSVIVLNKSVKIIKKKDESLNMTSWRAEIEQLNTRGINTMSLSEITGIPRATTSRKIKLLLKKRLAVMDDYKLIHPETSFHKNELAQMHSTSVISFSKFTHTICNLLIFN